MPRRGETLAARSWMPKCGGKGGNQAIEAARHGAAVAMIGAVGRDPMGDALLANLAARGVDATGVRRSERASGLTVALFDADGDYRGLFVPGANDAVGADWIAGDAARTIAGAAVLLLQNEVPATASRAAAQVARQHGRRVVWNAAPVAPVDAALLALTDVLVVNAIEAEGLGAAPVVSLRDAADAAFALAARAPVVVVTAGGSGLAVAAAGAVHTLGAHDVRVVSTHGAGDAFCGALAARLAAGARLHDAVLYANAAAAMLVATREDDRADLTADDARARLSLGRGLTPAAPPANTR